MKSRVRANRWSEEEKLLVEEMRRVRVTMEAKAAWWEIRIASEDTSQPPDILEGIAAYARQQAGVQKELLASFIQLWEDAGLDQDDEWEEVHLEEEGGESEDEDHVEGRGDANDRLL